MALNFNRELQLANTAQCFFQYFGFEAKLVCITNVLILAAATLTEIRARWRTAQLRGLENLIEGCVGEPRLLIDDARLDAFSWQHIGDEYRFRALPRVDTSEAVAAIDQLFNREFHA